MPTDGEGNRQDRPNASPDDRNSQELPASQVSSTRDSGSSASSSGTSGSGSNNAPTEDKDAIIESLRKEAAQRRIDAKRLAELEKIFQDAEDAKLTEQQKLDKERAKQQERIADLEREKQEYAIRADVKLAAAELGISQKLARLILSYEQITFDENGDPTNVADLLRAAAEEHGIAAAGAGATAANAAASNGNGRNGSQPHVSSGGAVNPGRSNTSNNGLFDGDPQQVMGRISRLSPSEYAARQVEIQAFLAQNWNRLRR